MNLFDTEDFNEQLLKHMIRSPEVLKAAQDLKLTPDDFLTSVLAGVQLYRLIASAILSIGTAPIGKELLKTVIATKDNETRLEGVTVITQQHEGLDEFIEWAYTDVLNTAFILDKLKDFAQHRRVRKVSEKHKVDPLLLAAEMAKIHGELESAKATSLTSSASPFAVPIMSEVVVGIPTGFDAIDAKIHGLAKQECGLIIGHSGSGKTAVTANMSRMCALNGYKALFISLEEPYQNIVHRWYAAQFKINYTQLHYGASDTRLNLELLFSEMAPITKETLQNLHIVDARALCPINVDALKTIVEQKAAEGFIPDVIFIDQLDYVTPLKQLPKGSMPWQEYQQSAFELDAFSQYKIQGKFDFALWVVHQGKGAMKWEFGYDDISGFRGIVKPFDICLGVGRHLKEEPFINLFSMKVRHTSHVKQSYKAEFEYMSFIQQQWSPEMLKKSADTKKKEEFEKTEAIKLIRPSTTKRFLTANKKDE